jgi:acyl-CoA thioester hydrolase
MKSRLALRVRYAETDQMGVAHHGSYFIWMEAARTELLREQGLSYRKLEERGYFLPVRDAHCRYRRGVQYDDRIIVESWLASLGGASLVIAYSIFREGEENSIIAEGQTRHAFTDKCGRVVRAPGFFKDLFEGDASLSAAKL